MNHRLTLLPVAPAPIVQGTPVLSSVSRVCYILTSPGKTCILYVANAFILLLSTNLARAVLNTIYLERKMGYQNWKNPQGVRKRTVNRLNALLWSRLWNMDPGHTGERQVFSPHILSALLV